MITIVNGSVQYMFKLGFNNTVDSICYLVLIALRTLHLLFCAETDVQQMSGN